MPSEVQVRVLRPHESVLISNNIDKVQITLFRALPSHSSSPQSSSPEQPEPSCTTLSQQQQQQQQKEIIVQSEALPWDSVSKDTMTDHVNTNNNSNVITDNKDAVNMTSTEHDCNNNTTTEKLLLQCTKQNTNKNASFYDSCAVAVYNEEITLRGGLECDYVGLGRVLSDCHGLQYIPHAVITGNEVIGNGYCSYNMKREPHKQHHLQSEEQEVQANDDKEEEENANIFAAGDTIEVDFDYLKNCKGILLGLTQYTNKEEKWISMHNTINNNSDVNNTDTTSECSVYYIIRERNSKQPLCLIPLHLHTSTLPTVIVLQLRPLHFAHGETMWEVNALQEFIPPRDIKHVVLALQDIAHDLFNLQCNDVDDDLRVIVKSRDERTKYEEREQKKEEGEVVNEKKEENDEAEHDNCFSHYCVIDGERVQIVGDVDNNENININDENDLEEHLAYLEIPEEQQQDQAEAQNQNKEEVKKIFKEITSLLTPEQKELYIHLKTQENAEFVQLLANVPHVTRTGRQQYNVGYACQAVHHMTEERTAHFINKYRKINKTLSSNKFVAADNEDSVRNDEDADESNDMEFNNDDINEIENNENDDDDDDDDDDDNMNGNEDNQDISEHNEILEEALRVAVPEYTRTRLVRYDNKAYNYGGDYHALAEHLVQHRASYARQLAEQNNKPRATEILPDSMCSNNTNTNNDVAFASSKNATGVILASPTPTPPLPLFAPHGLFANSCQELLMLQRMGALNGNDACNRPPLPPEFAKRKDSTQEAVVEKRRKSSVAKRKKSKSKRSKSKKRKGSSRRHSSKNKKRSKSKSKSKNSDNNNNKKGKKNSIKAHENEKHKEKTSDSNAKSEKTRHRSTSKQAAKRKTSHSPSRVADTIESEEKTTKEESASK